MNNKTFLTDVYDLESAGETRGLYRDWSGSYDAELTSQGYVGPARCAAALAGHGADPAAPLLDIGCGTGLSGQALARAGFTLIDGADFSAEMLEVARSKGVYRSLHHTDVADPFPFAPGSYKNASAIGLFSPGHAPPETIDAVLALLPAGGRFVFTLNDHALADPAYEAHIRGSIDSGRAALLFKEHGDHVTGIGLGATVYVLRKT